MNKVQQINQIIYSDHNLQFIKLWSSPHVLVHEDANEKGIFIAEENRFQGKYRKAYLLDSKGKYISQREFTFIDKFQDGMARIYQYEQGDGFINRHGKVVFEPVYDEVQNFHNGYGFGKKNNRWHLLNKTGSTIPLPENYKQLGVMENGRCAFSTIKEDDCLYSAFFSSAHELFGICGFFDDNGNEVIKPQYMTVKNFIGDYAVVGKVYGGKLEDAKDWSLKDTLYGVIDQNGNEIIPCQYRDIDTFYHIKNLFKVLVGDRNSGKWGIMDQNGNWVVQPQFPQIEDELKNGCFVFSQHNTVYDYDECEKNIFGIYDFFNRKTLIEPQFSHVEILDNNLFLVEKINADGNQIAQIIDRSGNALYPSDYSTIYYSKTHPNIVCKKHKNDESYGLITLDGSVILPCKYKLYHRHLSSSVLPEEKLVIFEENGLSGLMDFDQNILIPPGDFTLNHLTKNLFTFDKIITTGYLTQSLIFGIISSSGKIILPAEYDWIYSGSDHKLIAQTHDRTDVFEVRDVSV